MLNWFKRTHTDLELFSDCQTIFIWLSVICTYRTCYCTCFHFYSTMYIPPWESRAIAVYGRKYVVQRNRILSTAFYLKKLLNGTPITEMHSRRERGQNIQDQIAEIVKAKFLLVLTSKTLCKIYRFWFCCF